MSLFKLIFGSKNDRYLKKLRPIVREINALEPEVQKLRDEDFPVRMAEYREKVQKDGVSLDDILPNVFALVREAARRTMNMRHFDVQLIGGIVLHRGRIAEMKTGEGKTLVATLPVALNALSGKGVHVVTVNDYLASRDAKWMGQVYSFLGLTTGTIVHDMDDEQRKAAYACDITYGTNNEFGFDYLRDNMKFYPEQLVQRGHNYAIVDEVDSILIDEARTPLIISGASDESTELYQAMDDVVAHLDPDDYTVDEKARTAMLTEKGVSHCEELTHLDNLFDPRNMVAQHHIMQSLKAHFVFKRDVDYIVTNDQVVIVDEFTGRLMPGRRYSDGLHQALEAKEHVTIQPENQTLASITFQNYFRMYDKLAGMTGTADTEAVEFHEIYNLEVMTIPTNKPMIRKDYPDLIFQTQKEKFDAIVQAIRELYEKGQPVLVGTISIETSEMLSKRLKAIGIPHSVLNAKQHAKEAEIVAQAGQKGHVTIATNMAGRGTDIMLGEGVKELGGLHILGTERHESRRIDNQLRGRAGRQGDPGSSRFYLSLEDNLMRLFGSDRIKGLMGRLGLKDGEAIENKMVSKAVENAQKKVEAHHFDIRKTLLDYDNVMNQQREVIYTLRRELMETTDLNPIVDEFLGDVLNDIYDPLEKAEGEGYDEAQKQARARITEIFNISRVLPDDAPLPDKETCRGLVKQIFAELEKESGEVYKDILRYFLLEEVDRAWKEHLRNMDALRDGIGLRGYGQRDPKLEYKREGFQMFEVLLMVIRESVFKALTRVHVQPQPEQAGGDAQPGNGEPLQLTEEMNSEPSRAAAEAAMAAEAAQKEAREEQQEHVRSAEEMPEDFRHKDVTQDLRYSGTEEDQDLFKKKEPYRAKKKPGRNDPCPCGSGKKYKNCCGRFK
ncbi:MAG: preprotein translocase subunit SecA [Desulfovibrio sp.]|jgi:preprotein translocase subunit SecA|nr:preprotein translocase subunit SecA [Desulfovibrio sp.]